MQNLQTNQIAEFEHQLGQLNFLHEKAAKNEIPLRDFCGFILGDFKRAKDQLFNS